MNHVSSDNFDIRKTSLSQGALIGGFQRVSLLYNYSQTSGTDEISDLILIPPVGVYYNCRIMDEEMGIATDRKKTGKKIARLTIPICEDMEIKGITEVLGQIYTKFSGVEYSPNGVHVPFYNNKSDDSIGYLACKLIQEKSGKVLTKFYDLNKAPLEVDKVEFSVLRPAFKIGYPVPQKGGVYNYRYTIQQAQVKEMNSGFPMIFS